MAKGEIFTGLPQWAKGLLAVGLTAGVIWLGFKEWQMNLIFMNRICQI